MILEEQDRANQQNDYHEQTGPRPVVLASLIGMLHISFLKDRPVLLPTLALRAMRRLDVVIFLGWLLL
jgi:hypothetical protein